MLKRLSRVADVVSNQPFEDTLQMVVRKYFTSVRSRRSPFIYRGKSECVKIHHRNTTDDLLAIWQCFYRKQYEIPKSLFIPAYHRIAADKFYDEITASGRTPLIMDCGANIGAGTLWFAQRYPEAQFIVVEPALQNIAMLEKNIRHLNATILRGVVSGKSGTADLADPYGSTLAFRIKEPGSSEPSSVVASFTLKDLLVQAGTNVVPFILKIDVEGAEAEIFSSEGIEKAVECFPVLVIEPHDFMLPGFGNSSSMLQVHAKLKRDFLFWEENIFSIDMTALQSCQKLPAQ